MFLIINYLKIEMSFFPFGKFSNISLKCVKADFYVSYIIPRSVAIIYLMGIKSLAMFTIKEEMIQGGGNKRKNSIRPHTIFSFFHMKCSFLPDRLFSKTTL